MSARSRRPASQFDPRALLFEGHVAFFAGAARGLAVYRCGVSCSINPAMHPLPTAFPDFGLTPEQRHEAVFGHYYEYPGMDGERGEIWCYTPPLAYRSGETVTLHVSSTATQLPGRDRPRRRSGNACADDRQPATARWQDTPDQCSVEGCGWDADARIHVSPTNGRPAPIASRDGRRPRRQADLPATI